MLETLGIIVGVMIAVGIVLSIGKYRYENGYSQYSEFPNN
jgi:hypothetical protein